MGHTHTYTQPPLTSESNEESPVICKIRISEKNLPISLAKEKDKCRADQVLLMSWVQSTTNEMLIKMKLNISSKNRNNYEIKPSCLAVLSGLHTKVQINT